LAVGPWADLRGALVQRWARPWSCCFSSPLNHPPRCDYWFFERSCDPPRPSGEEFLLGWSAVCHSDRAGISFLRRPARCSCWQLTPVSCMCCCCAGLLLHGRNLHLMGNFAGVVCNGLVVAGRWAAPPSLPACSSGLHASFFAAWDGAAKPATLRSLVGGLAGGDVSGRRRSGLTLRFQGSVPCQQASAFRDPHPALSGLGHVSTRLACTIMR